MRLTREALSRDERFAVKVGCPMITTLRDLSTAGAVPLRGARRLSRGEMASTPATPADALEDARASGADPGETSSAPAPRSEPSAPECSSSEEDERASFGWSPAALAEYRQYAARVDELREASRARLAETRCAYDEHNALVETNEFVRRETALLDSLFAQILDATRGARADAFSGQAVVDDRARFALEASLRRAREGVEAVLRKSTAKRAKSERVLRDAKEAAAAAEDDARREAERFDALAAALPCHSTS